MYMKSEHHLYFQYFSLILKEFYSLFLVDMYSKWNAHCRVLVSELINYSTGTVLCILG